MSKAPNSVISLFAIIALLGLTVVSIALYSGNAAQRSKINNNFFWHKTKVVFDGAIGLLSDTSKSSSSKSESSSDNLKPANKSAKKVLTPSASGGFMSNTVSKIKQAWKQSDQTNTSDTNSNTNSENFLQWKPLASGAEIIFRSENGTEYKLLLPFKFLSR